VDFHTTLEVPKHVLEMTSFILSKNIALSKIALRTRRKICGFIVRQAYTNLFFRSLTIVGSRCKFAV